MIVRISILDTIINLYKPRIPGNCIKFVSKLQLLHHKAIFQYHRQRLTPLPRRIFYSLPEEPDGAALRVDFIVLPWKDSNPH